ncbi:unnamed protein product (macronuclear) [Paramecium tetraurelia]|uniref:Uncharacterized protein n=1 Tax=Paramecium tetraurelia TaxID=5888 RepID=A0DDU2_PARTE|nr:uncharacterized protein GSPATT00016050001 [Paramecium tetraurelia]CAK81209.1 unnamed protein product [Paramecium tetraurelia]|eukprot:XP_001448606.1 hypothetical protein (macronuclear) [Paramecium tetraurelia strain d4-2]
MFFSYNFCIKEQTIRSTLVCLVMAQIVEIEPYLIQSNLFKLECIKTIFYFLTYQYDVNVHQQSKSKLRIKNGQLLSENESGLFIGNNILIKPGQWICKQDKGEVNQQQDFLD